MRTKKMKLLIIVITIICSMICGTQTAFADELIEPGGDQYYCRLCKKYHDVSELSFSQKIAIEWNDIIYSGDWFGDHEVEGGPQLSTQDVLKFDTETTFSGVWSIAESFYNIVMPIGIILCFVYASIEVMEESTNDNLTPEVIVRMFAKTIAGVLIIQNGFLICTFVISLGSNAYTTLKSTNPTGQSQCLYYTFHDTKNFGKGMLAMSARFVPWLIAMCTKGLIAIMCWVRILDIMVKVIIAPIGIADLSIEGTRGSGFAFLKKLAVSGLQGAVLIAIMMAYGQVMSLIHTGTGNGTLTEYGISIICAVVTLIATFKSQAYAQEIIG